MRIVLHAAPATVEPVMFDPVPGLESIAVIHGETEVVFVGSFDDLRDLGYALIEMADGLADQ